MKSIFKSKTVIANLAAAAAMLCPPVQAVVAANPEATVGLLALINLILRFLTKDRVSLFPDAETSGK